MAVGSFLRSLLSMCSSSRKSSHKTQQTKKTRDGTHPDHQQPLPRARARDFRENQGYERAQGDTWPAPREQQPRAQPYRESREPLRARADVKTIPRKPLPVPKRKPVPVRRKPVPERVQECSDHQPPNARNPHNDQAPSTEPRLERSPRRHEASEPHNSSGAGSTVGVVSATDRAMSPETIREVIELIAVRFSHIPYAVSGLAAMAYYGYDVKPFKVSIICPEHTHEALKCWARAQGMLAIPRRQDIWGVTTADGLIRQFRVRFPHDFQDAHMVRAGTSSVAILSLAGLADEIARTYVNELKHADLGRQGALAKELMWVLQRIIVSGLEEHVLKPERAPHLVRETFWLPFTLSYPDSVPLFKAAGWTIPNDGW
ncbi:hypothetical protein FZEAL_8709 [Fusarium zealandicum]|uniref:Uncharacterized protein n=1 Tax=Fusarium zealandicum TaxID=1053134 RepID=A0A8H4XH80_9HYPO|nr:hypothetical protein FZEAL_8709 [Fusarium zealandicum]